MQTMLLQMFYGLLFGQNRKMQKQNTIKWNKKNRDEQKPEKLKRFDQDKHGWRMCPYPSRKGYSTSTFLRSPSFLPTCKMLIHFSGPEPDFYQDEQELNNWAICCLCQDWNKAKKGTTSVSAFSQMRLLVPMDFKFSFGLLFNFFPMCTYSII